MTFIETPLSGSFLVELERIQDARGFFARAWCQDEFRRQGLNAAATQLNVGYNHRAATLRGLHFQLPPHAEAKFVRCTRGAIYDVIVDLRMDSPTLGKWHGVELTADNNRMLYVPPGFAHGYQTLCDATEMYYLTTSSFAAAAARGVRYNDPAFGIKWPLPADIISEADCRWPDFSTALAIQI